MVIQSIDKMLGKKLECRRSRKQAFTRLIEAELAEEPDDTPIYQMKYQAELVAADSRWGERQKAC